MSHKWQVGQFLIYIGLIALVIFFITDQVDNSNIFIFCTGLLFVIFGGYVMWLGRNQTTPTERFRLVRKLSEKQEKDEKKKEKE
jgi:hypothetical protein